MDTQKDTPIPITWTTVTCKLSDLIPWEENPRTHSPEEAQRIENAITQFGYSQLIEIDPNYNLIDGHQRTPIMQLMEQFGDGKIEARMSSRPFSTDERKKYMILKHETAMGHWDESFGNLYKFDELKEWGVDKKTIQNWGVEEPEKSKPPAPQINRAEELRDKYNVELGQLWQLGDHRIICGDCTDAQVVDRLMAGEKADMVFTDPPYGMDLDTDYSNIKGSSKAKIQGRGGNKYAPVIGDNKDYDPRPVMEIYKDVEEQFWWGADYYSERIPNKNKGSWFVWDKRGGEDADKIIGSCFELCWSKIKHKRGIARIKWMGAFGYSDARDRKHPTQKPIALVEWFLERFTGNIIADPYAGSGTTLVACENLNRQCRAVEISPGYVAVAIERWHKMTNIQPKLISN
jgi:DNA modification methylase